MLIDYIGHEKNQFCVILVNSTHVALSHICIILCIRQNLKNVLPHMYHPLHKTKLEKYVTLQNIVTIQLMKRWKNQFSAQKLVVYNVGQQMPITQGL